jgi:3,4-dihydroxy 2-butanone 4-phosphate synthase/GTP cyclohydrolase II
VQTSSARIPTPEGVFFLRYFHNSLDQKEHLALTLGEIDGDGPVLTRIHSECFTGDVMGSLRCDCGPQLHRAMEMIAEAGRGVILYMRQEGRGIGLEEKLKAYNLQDQGYDTVDANLLLGHGADERDYTAAAHMLQSLGVRSVRLLTNNPGKLESLASLGIQVEERVPIQIPANAENRGYLATKVKRMRHMLRLDPASTSQEMPDEPLREHPQRQHGHLFHQLAEEAQAFHAAQNRPYVTLSYAQSLDGSISARPDQPLAISGPESLAWTHSLRASHQAILIGIGTALADDPSLTVRMAQGADPVPVVLDSHLRLPVDARLFSLHPHILLATTASPTCAKAQALADAGATLIHLPADKEGQVALAPLLAVLGQQGIASLMVEGGGEVITHFWQQGLANLAVITVAPILLGGVGAIRAPLYQMNGQGLIFPSLRATQTFQAGRDLILWGRVGSDH